MNRICKTIVRRFGLGPSTSKRDLGEYAGLISSASSIIEISNFNQTAFMKLESTDKEYNELQDRLSSGAATKRDLDIVKSKFE